MSRAARPAATSGITAAVIYTRVSSEEQEREGQSLAAQLTDCRRYAAAHGWVIAHEHQDVMSGKRNDRLSYQALLADVRRLRADGQCVVVVVKWLHRFGRRISERVRCWEELSGLGVPIHSVAEGGEQQELVFNILASVAQEESRQIGERVSATWRHITAQGWAKIGRVPWGYQLRPATAEERAAGSPMKVLEVDMETAPFVVEMFQKVAAGASARSVSLWAAKLPHDARGGRTLPWGSVQDALQNPLYAGRPADGVVDVLERPAGQWPALVPDDVWQAVQRRNEGHQRMAHQASAKYLLTGLLRCCACGGPMRGDNTGAPAGRYRCGGDLYRHCHQTVSRNVERQVLADLGAVVDVIVTNSAVQAGLRKAWQVRQRHAESVDESVKIRQLEAQVDWSRQRITRATELLVDGTIERQAYDDLVSKARTDMEAAESQLPSLRRETGPPRPKLPPLEQLLTAVGSWATVFAGADVVAQREVLAVMVDRIVATRERQNVYRVDITWTPLGEALRTSGAK